MLAVSPKRLDGIDALAGDGRGQREAGQRGFVVDQNRASAALAAVAAGFSAGEADLFAQKIEQQNIVGDRVGAVAPVERELKQPGQSFLPQMSARLALFIVRLGHTSASPLSRPIIGNGWDDWARAAGNYPNLATTSAGIATAPSFSGLALSRAAQTRVSTPSTARFPPMVSLCSTSKLERRNSATREAISTTSPNFAGERKLARASTSGMPIMPKVFASSRGFTPSAASNSI